VAVVLAALSVALIWTSSAAAATEVDCDGLQAALTAAVDGADIVLDSSEEANGLCNDSYTLKSFPSGGNLATWTLRGKTAQDGFDGTGLNDRVLTGDDVKRLTLMSLVFRNSISSSDGGALEITGDSQPAIFSSKFFNNHADSGKGGAVHISGELVEAVNGQFTFNGNVFGSESDSALGNSAVTGGAVSVETEQPNGNSSLTDNLFANNFASEDGGAFDVVVLPEGSQNLRLSINRVISNRAGGSGGGGHVVVDSSESIRLTNELYEDNSVEPIPIVDREVRAAAEQSHFGGGIYIESAGSQIFQDGNDFIGNAVKEFEDGLGYGGGGEAINGDSADPEEPVFAESRFDTFVDNEVPASEFESEGGGLFFTGTGATYRGWVNVVAGNRVLGSGRGGGIYVGAEESGTNLELHDSTVAGNSVGSEGQNAGLSGDGNDHLKLQNSIVYNTPIPDIGGFADFDVQYSDACEPARNGQIGAQADGTPFTGPGNICTDPLLVSPTTGDIHQTKSSPTIDKGNDELFFLVAGEGPFEDFEGDPRPTDGDGDGHTADMGADESPAFVPGTVTAIGQPPQCSDGRDNDGDGTIDRQDPGCLSGPNSTYNAADDNESDETLRDLLLCGRRNISLVRADLRGGQVALSGLVAARFAGRRVGLFVNDGLGWKKIKSVKSKRSGQFKARVAGPPPHLFNRVRYQARIGGSESAELKLPQSLASTSVRKRGQNIVVRGKVKRSLLGKRNRVIVRRLVCGRYLKVGEARPDRRGNYVVRFKAPRLGTAALYRAETRVLDRPGSRRYVKQYARAIGIRLTGSTG
jgi:hypothetical protein